MSLYIAGALSLIETKGAIVLDGVFLADMIYFPLGAAVGAILYYLADKISNRGKRGRRAEDDTNPNSTDSIATDQKQSTTTGIGTGVIHLFQLIKDNIGEDKTFVAGYCHLLGLACEHLGFDAAAAFLMDQNGKLALKGFHNLEYEPSDRLFIESEALVQEIARHEVPRYYEDPKQLPSSAGQIFKDFKAAWLVPLIPNRQFAGILVFGHRRIPANKEIYFPKLDFVGIAAGWFYENHHKEKLIEKENRKNAMLVNTSLTISSSLKLDEVCRVLVTNLGQAFGCSYSYVILSSDSGRGMTVRNHYSERGGEIFAPEERSIDIDEMKWLQDIIVVGSPVLLDAEEISGLPEKDADRLKIKGSAKTLIAPLKHAGRLEGILFIVEQRSAERTRLGSEVVDLCAALVAQAAAAIANARLYSMLTDRVAQIKTMFDVGQALNSDLDLVPFFEKILSAISDNFNFSNCSFFTRDFSTDELVLTSVKGGFPNHVFGKRLAIGKEGITGAAAAEKKIINVGDVSKDPRFVESTGNTASELAVPVILDDVVVGVLDVESKQKYAFGKREEDLLASIADQVAAAYEKIKLKQQEKERAQKLALVNGLVKRLSGMLDESQLLGEATRGLTEGFGFDHAAIFVPGDNDLLELAQQSCRYGDGYEPGTSFNVGVGLVGKVALQMTNILADESRIVEEEDSIKGVKSRFCLPLTAGYDFFGVLDLNDRRLNSFSPIDISTIQTFAEFLAVTINNTKLYREILEKANRLTLVDQINQAISATLEIEELFHRIAKSMSELTSFQMAALIVKDTKGYSVHSEYVRGGKNTRKLRSRLELESLVSEFEKVSATGESTFIPVVSLKNATAVQAYFIERGTNYVAICPIRQAQDIRGILLVGNQSLEGFSKQEIRLLQDVSAHLEIALNNALLYGEIKDAYIKLNEAQQKLIQSEKFKALGEVAAGIAHDFKNILAAVVGRAQLLRLKLAEKETIPRENIIKGLEVIEKSANDGVKILSRINEFARNNDDIDYKAIDLGEILNDSIEMARSRWEAPDCGKSIELTTMFNGQLGLMGDRAQLIEVFNNLLINAGDAIEREGKIIVTAESLDDQIKASITDNGVGMDPDTVQKIFDPFFTTKGRTGTGLGLTMAYAIIQRHGGDITVESAPGKGSTFTILLPKKIPELEAKGGINLVALSRSDSFLAKVMDLIAKTGNHGIRAKGVNELAQIIPMKSIRAVLVDVASFGDEMMDLVRRLKAYSTDLAVIPVICDERQPAGRDVNSSLSLKLSGGPSDLEKLESLMKMLTIRKVEFADVK